MIYVLIPTGRVERTIKCVKAWKEAGFTPIVSTWLPEVYEATKDLCETVLSSDRSRHPHQINYLVDMVFTKKEDAEAAISAADDLWPVSSYEEVLQAVRDNQGKILWTRDMLFDECNSHPVFTRDWWKPGREVFDPQFHHNYTDLDFMMRNLLDGDLVKCFDLSFDHRHPIKCGGEDWLNSEAMIWTLVDESYFKFKWDGQCVDNLLVNVPVYHNAVTVE
jgi:hypothetical protein